MVKQLLLFPSIITGQIEMTQETNRYQEIFEESKMLGSIRVHFPQTPEASSWQPPARRTPASVSRTTPPSYSPISSLTHCSVVFLAIFHFSSTSHPPHPNTTKMPHFTSAEPNGNPLSCPQLSMVVWAVSHAQTSGQVTPLTL